LILINGLQQDRISVNDRALHYGDGLFETFAVKDGEALAWDRHIARLQTDCARLGIECPAIPLLQSEAAQLCEGRQLAVLKLIISRGEGGRGYQPPQIAQTTRIFSLHDWPDYPLKYQQQGIEAGICEMRLGHNPLLAGMKHLNRLEQVLIRQKLAKTPYAEVIVMDINDKVIEGSMSNIFLVKNEQIFTPELSGAGVAGVIRGRILELARAMNLDCEVRTVSLDDVLRADEIFFCNSVAGVWPVARIKQTTYQAGPITRRLRQPLSDENLIVNL
jgi:4-amino-4-deoxychorismate lyase